MAPRLQGDQPRAALSAPRSAREWSLRFRAEGGATADVSGALVAHEPTSPLFTLTLVGPSLDAASLETRQLSLTADGREAFEGVVVWVALLDAGEVVVDGEHPLLGPLPQTVAQDASVWQPLAIAARARRSSLFSLRVEIGALARAEWPLPQPAQGEATADGASSAGHGDPLWCAARAPLSASERGEPNKPDGP